MSLHLHFFGPHIYVNDLLCSNMFTDHELETCARGLGPTDDAFGTCIGQWRSADHELETCAKDLGPTDHKLETWVRGLGLTDHVSKTLVTGQ